MKSGSGPWHGTWQLPVLLALVGGAALYLLLPLIDKGLKSNQPAPIVDRRQKSVTDIPQPATQEAVHPSVQQPDETARIEPVDVTAWDLSRFPKVYEQRQRVHIVRWGKGMVMDVDDLKAGRKGNINPTNIDYERLPLDCKFLIVISLGLPNGGCLSTVPEVFAPGPNLTKVITSGSNGERRALEFTVAEPLTDLDCDFKAGVWNCVLSPSEYFKMKEREREHYKEMEEQERRLEKKQ